MKLDSDEQIEHQDKRNPVKKAEKQAEFRNVGQLKDVFTNPQDIYKMITEYSTTIKKVSNQHPKQKKTNIIDFSLYARGPNEDKIYVKHKFYRRNVRRGNTIVYNLNDKKAYWGRKGLMKFFDISIQSLQAIANEDLASLDKRDQYNHYTVFEEVENVLSCNQDLDEKDKAKVHVYTLNKANGQNTQISYFKPTDQWVVSSKNVSILVKGVEDLKLYNQQRYSFAKLMAETWFNMIKDKTKNQIQKLKQALWGKTIVGEYCGNPDFQHLVKYKDIIIYFYAAVEHESIYTCIPPPDAFKFFQQHGLPIVKNHEKSLFGVFTNFAQLGKKLINLYSQVSRSSIFQDQQGNVVYFLIQQPKAFCEYISDHYLQNTVPIPEKWQQKDVWWHVSSLGKLKTLQYRILRKLRQKLRSFGRIKKGGAEDALKKQNDAKKFEQKYGSFQKECYQLLRKQKLNKPLEYYFCMALISFQYVFKNRKSQKNLNLLNNHYIDFLSVVFWCIENKKQVTPALMSDDKLIQQLRGQNWEKYNIEIVKDYQKLLNNIVPRYAKIKKTMKIGENEQSDSEEKEQPLQNEDD